MRGIQKMFMTYLFIWEQLKMRTYYEHTKTGKLYSSYEGIAKKMKISTAWVHKLFHDKKLTDFKRITEKEVLRRAQLARTYEEQRRPQEERRESQSHDLDLREYDPCLEHITL